MQAGAQARQMERPIPSEPKVFISYSHVDRGVAQKIATELQKLGFDYFLDEKDVAWGERVEGAVHSGIRRCSHLLVVISRKSHESSWVPFEIGLARGMGLTILPLLIDSSLEPFPFVRDLLYKTDISAVRDYFQKLPSELTLGSDNPKPYAVGATVLSDMYLMFGNHTTTLPVNARYRNEPLAVPPEIRPHLEDLKSRAQERVRRSGAQYFNGPNTRLIRFTEEGTRQLDDGRERKEVTLELGPVSWEEYTILNTFLDYPLHTGTIRELFASREKLFQNDRDMSWCQLSGILSLGVIPVTSDGFGLVQYRNPRGVSTEGGRFTSGLAENIHRFLDEAPADDLFLRVHELDLPIAVHKAGNIGVGYAPEGVPSPYLAAHRGLWEEVSESLADELPLTSIHFLNVGFELSKFQPVLIGVIDLGVSRAEVERRRRLSPGRDHSEFLDLLYLPLDHVEPQTSRILINQDAWVPGGLAAFVSAIHYWKARSR